MREAPDFLSRIFREAHQIPRRQERHETGGPGLLSEDSAKRILAWSPGPPLRLRSGD